MALKCAVTVNVVGYCANLSSKIYTLGHSDNTKYKNKIKYAKWILVAILCKIYFICAIVHFVNTNNVAEDFAKNSTNTTGMNMYLLFSIIRLDSLLNTYLLEWVIRSELTL